MTDTKKIVIKFENYEYMWHKKIWTKLNTNLTINTALEQRLTIHALKNGLLTEEDIKTIPKESMKEYNSKK